MESQHQAQDKAETARELEEEFWEALDDSPFMMIGLQGVEDSRTRPMTAQIDNQEIYFFADRREHLVLGLTQSKRVVATYVGKDHKVFAHIHGTLSEHRDAELLERLWNPIIASWYEGGKDDPNLVLLKFDTEKADIWEASAGATLKAAALKMLGMDPGKEHQEDHRAKVTL